MHYTVKELKALGREKALILKDKLEDINCNIDYSKDFILYGENCNIINLIEQIYIFQEI